MKNLLKSTILALAGCAGYASIALASELAAPPTAVPEPTALGLLSMGVAALVLGLRARKK